VIVLIGVAGVDVFDAVGVAVGIAFDRQASNKKDMAITA
jgi:hypothetical protein